MPEVKLTKKQIEILYQILCQINWPGAQVEIAVDLKKIFKDALDREKN